MVRNTILLALALILTACATTPAETPLTSAGPFVVSPLFTSYYESHGGARLIGAPISSEVLENGLTVQYFQNAKLEFHPQLPADVQVIMAGVGQAYYGLAPCVPAVSAPDTLYFNNCHSVDPAFRGFFEEHGGLAFFGYPISERYTYQTLLAQNFERATIVWDSTKPTEYQFGLLPLGALTCPDTVCNASFRSAIVVVPPQSTPTTPADADPITRFYLNHGGSRVFGLPVGTVTLADDGAHQQIYDNAILYEDPSTPEGVRLRSLGLKLLGQADLPAVPTNGPHTAYFAKYGHNISYAVFDFYKANGGDAVFGQPITELQTANSFFVQYFENAVFTVHYNLPPDQIVQLMPLGRQVMAIQAAPARTVPPQLLVVRTQPLFKMLDPVAGPQTLTARVLDENTLAVAGAQVQFIVHTPQGDMEFVSTTDADGFATYAFTLTTYAPGDYMIYDVKVTYGSLTGEASDSFVTWGAPTP